MAVITTSKHFQAPLPRVFEVFSDIEHCDQFIPAILKIEKLSDGPMGVGFKWRETRLMFKKEATEEMWVTVFEPNQRYVVVAESHGAHYESTYTFHEEAGGTRVELTFSMTPVTFMAKVMSPLGYLFKSMLRKCFEADHDAIEKFLEGGTSPEVAAV